MPSLVRRRLRQDDGGVLWRLWAPFCRAVSLVISAPPARREIAMAPEQGGFFVHRQSQAEEGLRYAFQLPDGGEYPDPASRWQPEGVHAPSAVFFPESYPGPTAPGGGVAREDW